MILDDCLACGCEADYSMGRCGGCGATLKMQDRPCYGGSIEWHRLNPFYYTGGTDSSIYFRVYYDESENWWEVETHLPTGQPQSTVADSLKLALEICERWADDPEDF